MLFSEKGHFDHADPAELCVDAVAAARRKNRLMIPHGDSLFAPGAQRQAAYRVESGALCHYVVWPDGSHDVIEIVFPGDVVGLGSLAEHVSTAQAMVDTCVSRLSDEELSAAIEADAALAARLASATDREFDFLRRRALQPGERPVVNRIAAYLMAVAGGACRSGETHVAVSSDGIETLSALLEIAPAAIREALADLQSRGLIAEREGTMVISDFDGLELLADA